MNGSSSPLRPAVNGAPGRRVGGFRRARRALAVFVLAMAACGQPVPASAPLSKSTEQAGRPEWPASTRAEENAEGNEHEVEKSDAGPPEVGDDDDDDDSARRPGSGSAASGAPGRGSSELSGSGAGTSRTAECRSSAGPPLDCARLPRGSATCMGQALARRVCETVGPALEPAIGALWLACMREHADKARECDTSRIFDCGLKAIDRACVDGSEHAVCADIVKSCAEFAPEITVSVCEHALGAWKPDRRESLLSCLRRGCEVGDFGACLP